MAHPDEQDVALADTDALVALGGGDVAGRDVVARFQPGHPAQAGDIEEHAAAGDAVGGDGDGELNGTGGGDGAGGHAVVEGAVEGDMAQGVDVAVGVAVDVHGDPVGRKFQAIGGGAGRLDHPVLGRVGVVGAGMVLYRGGE